MSDLSEARGYMDLEMWEEAWLALDAVPAGTVATAEMVRIRLRAAAGMERWDFVEELASILKEGNEEDRMEAACAYQSLAAEHYCQGRVDKAREMVRVSIEIRPEQLLAILADPRLPENFV